MKKLPLFLPLILTGCFMVGPDYRRPDFELPAAFGEPGVASSAIEVPQRWWTLYGDATLDELVRAGLGRNADVRLAGAPVEEAEAPFRQPPPPPPLPPSPA